MSLFATGGFQIFLAWVLSTSLFSSLILYISKHPKKRNLSLKIIFIAIFLGGTAMYCSFHYSTIDLARRDLIVKDASLKWVNENTAWPQILPYVIVRSTIDVGRMFCGHCNTEVFYKLPIANEPLYVFLFWLVQLIVFYTTATALLIRFGNDLLRLIKMKTSKVSEVDLVFGVNSDSLSFGRNIAGRKGSILVYVDSVIAEDYEASIREIGGLTYSGQEAAKASPSFLYDIRVNPKKTKLKLYAFSGEYDRNLQYARMMSESLEKVKMIPENTGLVLLGTDEWKGMMFQSGERKYGYGSVVSFDEYEMAARLLMYKYPLCNAINFDENCRAAENMNVLIVGFGRIGHEVLRKVIANGQFEGSKFHATVYDPNFEHRTGFIKSQYPMMFANYNIDFEPQGGRGNKIFKFIQDNAKNLKYIVICIEDRDVARDIAIHMVDRLHTLGCPLNVYTCDTKSVRCYSQYVRECETHWLYDSELLYSGELDRYAMELNHRYTGGKSLNEDWKNCAYFERMSSRASVDYLIPLIRRIKLKVNSGELTSIQRENLAKSEHLRWCAFHYTFGYDLMERDEFIQRVRDYHDEVKRLGKSKIKVTKDKNSLKHVCLVDWDELDEISRIENQITNGSKDYKEYDRGNVDMVMDIALDETYHGI